MALTSKEMAEDWHRQNSPHLYNQPPATPYTQPLGIEPVRRSTEVKLPSEAIKNLAIERVASTPVYNLNKPVCKADLHEGVKHHAMYIIRSYIQVERQPKLKRRLMIVGHGRSGKDTCAEILGKLLGYRYGGGTSYGIAPIISFALSGQSDLATQQKLYAERHTHREYWYDACNMLRQIDPLMILKLNLAYSDFLIGLRSKEEFINGLDYWKPTSVIWVARRGVLADPTLEFGRDFIGESCNDRSIHHITIGNNDSVDVLESQLQHFLTAIAPIDETGVK